MRHPWLIACLLALLVPTLARAAKDDSAGADQEKEEKKKKEVEIPAEMRPIFEAVERFEAQAREFGEEIQLLIERKYKERRDRLDASYERAIEDVEVHERKNRLDAIALFEEFLSRYPSEPKYSPDAMMRLAELYYEKIEDDFRIEEKAYYAMLDELEASGDLTIDTPPPPEKRYENPIALYQRLINDFPDYRYGDAAHYLLGYLLGEQYEMEEALAVFDRLIRSYPKSRFVAEVWMRIGEFFFDADQNIYPDALRRAIAAYTNVLPYKDHPLYDKVLYKLGWTYYRIDDYDQSVGAFMELLSHYERTARDEGEDEAGGDLRREAIQYTAIAFADETWGSIEKARRFFEARGHPPYEFDVIRRLGDVLFDMTKHPLSVEAYTYLLSRYPLHRDAPQIQERIIAAHERDRRFQDAFKAQEELADNYSEGSAWWEAHKDHPDILANARDLTERSLRAGAVFHHEQAQKYREEEKIELAFTEYKQAADAYGKYLQMYPHTKDLYEFTYYYADSLYNSAQFMKAAEYFAQTRDSNLDSTYLEDSALGAVLALEKEIARQQQTGEIPEKQVVTSKDWPKGKPVVKETIPELWLTYVDAGEKFVKRLPDTEWAPNIAYKSAEVFYVYGHHEEARRRFKEMAIRYPNEESAQYAANLALETYLIAGDWKMVEEFAGEMADLDTIKASDDPTVRNTFIQFKLGARFKRAQKLFDVGKYEEAAQLYLALIAEAPRHEFADRALYNAAVSYEKVLRFESALKLYERVFRDYPKSDLADQALFLVAYNAERAFNFEKAIEEYLALVKNYPQSQQRQGALNNAGILLYLTQQYGSAARQFQRFARMFPDAPQVPKLLLLAAESREKQGDERGAIAAYEEFIRRFRNTPTAASNVVEAHLKIAQANEETGQKGRAQSAYQNTVRSYARLADRMKDGDVVAFARASDFAAEAQFMIAEKAFREYDAVKILGKGKGKKLIKNLKASMEKKLVKSRAVAAMYKSVYGYHRLDWTLAAAYRLGFVLERFAAALFDSPVPLEIRRLPPENTWAYQDVLAQFAAPVELEAQKAYVTAVEKSREAGIVNKWTKLTLESLNRYQPDAYPILKEARDAMESQPLSGETYAPTIQGIPQAGPVGTRLGGDDDEDEK